ncbi:MAG: hypothetical protein JWP09_494 [Candidatus Taylorbacteria bacterium]|nr:hypothetical protein [Candidatus Taylorbacteria bacterium]
MQNSQAPKNFFIQIGIFASLYISAISFLVFLFSVINHAFPQVLDYYPDTSAIRFSISTLIVVFPLFIWLGRVYRKFVVANPEYKESKLRKWITYFTLTLTGATIAGDVIVLINSFLAGADFTAGFLLKVLSVFVVTGGIFIYCLKDLKGYFDEDPKRSKIWAIAVSVIVLLSIIIGFVMIGSPKHQRDVNYDAERVSDLSNLQYQVVNYYQQKGSLPVVLSDMVDPLSGNVIPLDPETFKGYEYKTTGKLSFEVCANFKTLSDNSKTAAVYGMTGDESWQHGAERTCFARNIDPQKYPLISGKN